MAMSACMREIILSILLVLCSSVCCGANSDEKKALELHAGVTEAEVIASWGLPAKKSSMLKDGKRKGVWIYNCQYQTPCPQDCEWYYEIPCYYLFFEHGVLTGWHDVR